MAVRNDFAAGEVLAAADLNDTFASKVDYALPANAQSGTGASAYTFVLADASRLTTATGTSAKTFTIPPQTSVTWIANSIIRVANYGAGDLTIAGGSGVTVTNATKTLAQFESAALVRTGSNAWTLIPFSGGAGNADFSNAATGTYTDGGVSYKYLTFTASGTLTVTKAGFADVLVIGGGGGGGQQGGGGGAGGHLVVTGAYLPAGSLTVTVGAGGAGGAASNVNWQLPGAVGAASRVGSYYSVGGGGGGSYTGGAGTRSTGFAGGSGGGAGQSGALASGGAGTSDQGNAGGNNTATSASGGGGGANAAGSNGVAGPTAGSGGSGLASSITGSSVTRAGGGGGGSRGGTAGSGGSGGGGGGTTNNTTGTAGTVNTGGGGGGGGYASGAGGAGGAGGSGVVIVRVKT